MQLVQSMITDAQVITLGRIWSAVSCTSLWLATSGVFFTTVNLGCRLLNPPMGSFGAPVILYP